MPFTIGLAGKGGTGKTTIAGFLIKYLVEKGKTPVLAVDADSNANLNEVLGVQVKDTLGNAREEMKKGVATGITKDVFMEMKLEEAVIEAKGFDLIVMGRPEGAGCYCAANSLLLLYLEKLIDNYSFIVMDNEAGMEHISRLTTKDVDILIVVSDASRRGMLSAARISELTDELGLKIGKKCLIINQAKENETDSLKNAAAKYKLNLAGIIPEDDRLREFDLEGLPTIELDMDSKSVAACFKIFDEILKDI